MARTSARKREAAGAAASGPPVIPVGNATLQVTLQETLRAPFAAPPTESLTGYIDAADSSQITGWIWNPQRPGERVAIDLLDGDTQLVRVLADKYRSDLRQAGIGDGRHAYAIPIGDLPLPSGHVLHLRCADTGVELPGSPITIQRGAADAAPGMREAATPYLPAAAGSPGSKAAKARSRRLPETGPHLPAAVEPALASHIDFADWTGVRGWIWDPQQPNKPIALELADGETVLATLLANDYRPDLEEAGIGDGRHGFSVPFGETLLPNSRHVVHLRPVGSRVELPSFPLVLTRSHAGIDASALGFMHSNVAAETRRALTSDDLAPLIGNLTGMLDQALTQYFRLAGHDATAPPLPARELGPQTRALLQSIETHYPKLALAAAAEPVVSIVIPVFNKFNLTYGCIKSIVEHGAELPFEIVVVDDGSRDETLFAGFVFGAGIRLVRSAENGGFIRACNRGFAAARGAYVVFLNNDTEVKPGWLDELYQTFAQDPTIGVAGAKLLYPQGTLQECGGLIWRLGDGWNWGRGEDPDDPRYCYMRDADYVSGAALMIKRSLFDELGKFDELYLPAYYEDTDLCFRARQRGYRVVVQPAAQVIHFEGASGGTSTTGTGIKRFQAINHRKFLNRWKETLASHRLNGDAPELEAERTVRQRALFIDATVPEPDKDAGSNAALQHMLSLQRLGYKVTFVPADNMARIDPYTADLQRRGIECLYDPHFPSVEDVFRRQKAPFDLVYLHRYSNASQYAGMIRQHFPAARILYNVADLHFLRMQREAALQGDDALRARAEQLRRIEIGAMSFVDCVIVHSSAEAQLLQQIAPDVEVRVIPWTVALRDAGKPGAAPSGAAADAAVNRDVGAAAEHFGIAFVGGYRHPPNVDAAKWAAESIMPLLRREVPEAKLLLVGSNMPPEVRALAAKDVVPLGYVPSLDSVFDRVKLTIAPLRYGAGLKGKVLESMAAGIPCVMTTVAAEGLELPAALTSLVSDDPAALAARIAKLCRDPADYRRVAKAGKAHIAANYSPARIDALIREACGRA